MAVSRRHLILSGLAAPLLAACDKGAPGAAPTPSLSFKSIDITADDIMVLQNAGPNAPECMPEAGYLPIPKKLARAGLKDMVRISDARMSGTAFGTIVLHVTPDAASGGPLALVRNGDRIKLSIAKRTIDLLVDEPTLAKRRAEPREVFEKPTRGYAKLFAEEITGADLGCDFRFLRKAP